MLPFFVLLLLGNCSGGDRQTQDKNNTSTSTSTKDPKAKKEPVVLAARYLDGKKFDDSIYEGDRIVFAFFDINRDESPDLITALKKLAPLQQPYRFHIVLVSVNHDKPVEVKKFLDEQDANLPVVLDDAQLSLAVNLGIEDEVSVRVVDNKHVPSFGIRKYSVFADDEEGEESFLAFMKENLGVKEDMPNKPILGYYPPAPDFTVTTVDGKTLKLSSLRGKVVQVIFFLPTCPHCQEEMFFIRDELYPELHAKGYEVVALAVADLKDKKQADLLKSFKFSWPVADDGKREVRKKFSKEGSVPENYIIDKQGNIRYMSTGFDAQSHKSYYRVLIKKLLGMDLEPEKILTDKRFNGSATCGACHESQYVQWQSTPHAHAWETLELKGETKNPECVSCHSIGMNDPRGYKVVEDKKTHKQIALVPPLFQNVQCENCHGIGGPHKSPAVTAKDMEKSCMECHTEKFSLHFDFHERVKKVDHSNKADIMKMKKEERLALLTKVVKDPGQLFGKNLRYVGSNTCMECHKETHKNWTGSVHAKAFTTLKDKNKTDDPECLKCHTTGYGQLGGYQEKRQADLESVSCESCHGPGEQHIKTQKKTDIRGLGDDCPFCVIEQICLSCHDATNSPNFNIHKGLRDIKGHGPNVK